MYVPSGFLSPKPQPQCFFSWPWLSFPTWPLRPPSPVKRSFVCLLILRRTESKSPLRTPSWQSHPNLREALAWHRPSHYGTIFVNSRPILLLTLPVSPLSQDLLPFQQISCRNSTLIFLSFNPCSADSPVKFPIFQDPQPQPSAH